jgi:site-specific DNA recombinase
MRAVIYPRVSSQQQKDRHTIDSQLRELPEFVRERGWTLARPAETYVDDGRSARAGKLDERAGLQQLLKDAQAGLFDVVAVVDLDRLTRSEDLIERAFVLGSLQRAKIVVAEKKSGQVLDLNSTMGDLMSSLGGFFAAEENRKRRERTVRGKLEAIRKGRKPSGPTPFGLSFDKTSGDWKLDEPNAAIVCEIYTRVIAGESCDAIGYDFDRRGIKRPRAGSWSRERVWQIARASTYRGIWVADKARGLTVPVPPIVDEACWQAAQDSLARWGLRGITRRKYIRLCADIAVCGICGSQIGTTTTNDWHGNRVAYYVCSRRRRVRYGDTRCTLPMRRVDEVDGRIWRALSELLLRPDLLEKAVAKRKLDSGRDKRDWSGDLATFRRKLADMERAETIILDRFRRGLISPGAMDHEARAAGRHRKMLERQIEVAELEFARVDIEASQVDALSTTIADLRGRLATATQEIKREIVRALVPGRDDHVIRVFPKEIDVGVVLAARSGGGTVVPCDASSTS